MRSRIIAALALICPVLACAGATTTAAYASAEGPAHVAKHKKHAHKPRTAAKRKASKHGKRGPQGKRGPAGPTGPQGAQGAAGAPGSPGISGYEVVHQEQTVTVPPDKEGEVTADAACPAGKVLLGGAGNFSSQLREPGKELPLRDGPGEEKGIFTNTWVASYAVENTSFNQSWTITAQAIAYCGIVS